jgi:iron complex outermembrane recepter protein
MVLEWDAAAYYVAGLRTNLSGLPDRIGSYTRMDTRLGWRPNASAELSIVGQNLLSPNHLEFPNAYQLNSTQVQRSIFGRISWRF